VNSRLNTGACLLNFVQDSADDQRCNLHWQVWDANRLDVVADFRLEARVYAIAMSRIATAHCLIAAAGTDPQVGFILRVTCVQPHQRGGSQ